MSVRSGVGYHPPPATHRPAAQLRLAFQITDQYSATAAPRVFVLVHVFEGTNPREVSFAAGARLTCNGTDITPNPPGSVPIPDDRRPCPRQSPGGTYRLAYTDEHGAATTVVVPVPAGSFAILSPRAGATVPIPTHGPLAVRYTLPVPPPDGSVAIVSVNAACSLGDTHPCGSVFARLPDNTTSTPSAGVAPAAPLPAGAKLATRLATPAPASTPTPGQDSGQDRGSATPAPGATPTPGGSAPSPAATATATATQSGDTGTILLTGDFTEFQPAPGLIQLSLEARVTPDRGDFAAVTAIFSDNITEPVTWAR